MEFAPENGPDEPEAVRLTEAEATLLMTTAKHGHPVVDHWMNSHVLRYRTADEAAAQAWARLWSNEQQPSTVGRDHLGWYIDADQSAIQRGLANHLERRAD